MTMSLRVAIVEDDLTAREGLAYLVTRAPGFTVVGEYESVEDAMETIAGQSPDVLLLDIGLPGRSGTDALPEIRRMLPDTQILILTVFADDEHVFRALCNGAHGYLLKDTPADGLLQAIRDVAAGGSPISPAIARRILRSFGLTPVSPVDTGLSPREREVLGLLAEGYSYLATAGRLDLSIDTVRSHVRNIYEKLHVHSRAEAVLKAMRAGWLR
jgi:DNA-binding NarL/FixJ family response regulator